MNELMHKYLFLHINWIKEQIKLLINDSKNITKQFQNKIR